MNESDIHYLLAEHLTPFYCHDNFYSLGRLSARGSTVTDHALILAEKVWGLFPDHPEALQ